MSTVYLNDHFMPLEKAHVSIMDRGFLFADGVYEVIPVYAGKLFRLEKHLARLQRSLDAIHLDYKIDYAFWAKTLKQLVIYNTALGANQSVYVQITRGTADPRAHVFPDDSTPTIFCRCNKFTPKTIEALREGINVITHPDIRWEYCFIKSIALLPNVLLSEDAKKANAHEAILFRDDVLTEGASSNVFLVKNDVLYTPPLSNQILGGITRDLILELAKKHKLAFEESELTKTDLLQADEVWISSSTREVVPVINCDGQKIGNGKAGPTWENMINWYRSYKQTFALAQS